MPDPSANNAIVISSLLARFSDQGGKAGLRGVELDLDVSNYSGMSDLVDELKGRTTEAIGYLATQRPSKRMPAQHPPGTLAWRAPLSSAQRQWSDVTRNPLQEQWLPLLVRLDGVLNREAFEASFKSLINHYDILRTRYVNVGGEDRQEEAADVVALDFADLTNLPPNQREMEIWRKLKQRLGTRIPLDQGTVELTLFRIAERQHILGGFIHHITLDAPSFKTVLNELMSGYYGRVANRLQPLPDPKQYRDFALWENSWLTEDDRTLSDLAWDYELRGAKSVSLRPPANVRAAPRIDVLPLVLPGDILPALETRAREMGATLNIVFLAVLSVALARLNGASHALLGQIFHGRPPGFDGVVGSFVQLRPFYLAFEPDDAFRDVVSRARRMFALSSSFSRPASVGLLQRTGTGNVIVNYTKQSAVAAKTSRQAGAASLLQADRDAGMRGAVRTTTVTLPSTMPERVAKSQIPSFFKSQSVLKSGALVRPRTGIAPATRAIRPPNHKPKSILGLSATLTTLPERLQSEFHRDLHFAMTQTAESLRGAVTYDGANLDQTAVATVVADIVRMFELIAANPGLRVSQLIATNLQ